MAQDRRGGPDGPMTGRHLQTEDRGRSAPQGAGRKRLIGIAAVIAVLLLAAASVMYLCFRTDRLEGTWRYDEVTAYEFDGRGSGKLLLPDKEYAFTYKLTDSELSIDFENEAAKDAVYDYSVSGDELTMSCGEGNERVTYLLKMDTVR